MMRIAFASLSAAAAVRVNQVTNNTLSLDQPVALYKPGQNAPMCQGGIVSRGLTLQSVLVEDKKSCDFLTFMKKQDTCTDEQEGTSKTNKKNMKYKKMDGCPTTNGECPPCWPRYADFDEWMEFACALVESEEKKIDGMSADDLKRATFVCCPEHCGACEDNEKCGSNFDMDNEKDGLKFASSENSCCATAVFHKYAPKESKTPRSCDDNVAPCVMSVAETPTPQKNNAADDCSDGKPNGKGKIVNEDIWQGAQASAKQIGVADGHAMSSPIQAPLPKQVE